MWGYFLSVFCSRIQNSAWHNIYLLNEWMRRKTVNLDKIYNRLMLSYTTHQDNEMKMSK